MTRQKPQEHTPNPSLLRRRRRGRPSKMDILLVIIAAKGGRVPKDDIIKDIEKLNAFSRRSLNNYIKLLKNYGEPLIDGIRLSVISTYKSSGVEYFQFPHAFAPKEIIGYILHIILFIQASILFPTSFYLFLISYIIVNAAMIFRAAWGLILHKRHKHYEPPKVLVYYHNHLIFKKKFKLSDTIRKVKEHAIRELYKQYNVKGSFELTPKEEALKEYYKTYYKEWNETQLYQLLIFQGLPENKAIIFNLTRNRPLKMKAVVSTD